jgi:hypothetical protein
MTLEFDEFIGQESINCEYKEFTYNLAPEKLDQNQCEDYCSTNLFDFNRLTIDNIKKYFDIYLPKYVSCFLNLEPIRESKLYIGINDLGFVRGIPYKGQLPIQKLTNYAYKLIYKRIKVHGNELSFNFFNYIKINFIKVNFNSKSSKIHPNFIHYLKEKEIFKQLYNQFLVEFDAWKIKFDFINKKLSELGNDINSRSMLINYIKSLDPFNPVIDLLMTDYQFENKSHIEIAEYKQYNTNPYYWVSRWKDEYKDYIISIRPRFNSDFMLKNVPYNLILSIHSMIPYWMNNNNNMNLYVIQFNIISPLPKHNISIQFIYYDYITNKWYYCKRQVSHSHNEPMCIKITI